MFSRRFIVLSVCGLLTGALTLGLYAQARSGSPRAALPGRQAGEPDATGPQPTRVQVDLFEVVCTNDQLIRLKPDALYRPAGEGCSVADVAKQLGEFGSARLLVRIDNVLNLTGRSNLSNGKQAPTVQDVVVGKGGVVTPSVSYQDVGFKMELEGRWRDDAAPARADIRCEIDCSNVVKSGTEIGSGVTLPAFAKLDIGQYVTVTSGQPIFIVSNDLPGRDGEKALINVSVVRLVATRLPD